MRVKDKMEEGVIWIGENPSKYTSTRASQLYFK